MSNVITSFYEKRSFSSTKKSKSGMNKRQESDLGLNLGAAKSLDRRSHSHGSRGSNGPGASSDDLSALLALPNTHARSLHGVLTAEGASIATRHTRMRGPTCCAGRSQSSSQSYGEKNRISFRTFRKFQPS